MGLALIDVPLTSRVIAIIIILTRVLSVAAP